MTSRRPRIRRPGRRVVPSDRSPTTRRTRPARPRAHTDTYHGHFARLVPDEQVVEVLEFETADPGPVRRDDDNDDAHGRGWGHRGPRRARGGADGAFPRPTTSWARGWRSVILPRWWSRRKKVANARAGGAAPADDQPALRGTWPPLTRAATPATLPACDIAAAAPVWSSTYWSKNARVTRPATPPPDSLPRTGPEWSRRAG